MHDRSSSTSITAPIWTATGGGGPAFAVSRLSAPDGSWDEKGTVLSYFSDMKTRGPAWAHGARTPLAAAVSRDEGATWGAPWLLEDDPDGWFCYTSVHPLADGTVLLGYCAFEELAHSRIAKVPVAWLYGEAK